MPVQEMEKILCCLLLINGRLASSQLLGTVRNVNLVDHITYILKFMEAAVHDIEEYGWSNLKVPDFVVDVEEDVFEWHVKGRATFKNAFVVSVQNVEIIRHTVQQIWRFDNTDNTTSVFCQATLRMREVSLGYDIDFEMEDGTHHYYTGLFKHNNVEFPFQVIRNMFTEEFSATVTMSTLPRSTNKMVFAPSNSLSQILSHQLEAEYCNSTVIPVDELQCYASQYDVTSAAEGMAAWGPNVFQPILLDVAKNKVPFAEICYNCPV